MALPAHSLVWDEDSECLYTGDESGRVRKWCIKNLLKELSDQGLGEKNDKASTEDERYGQSKTKSMGRRSTDKKSFASHDFNDVSNYKPVDDFDKDKVLEFVWGCECHDDSCSVSMVSNDGVSSLLTYSSDRTVKMWTTDGRPMGTLLAGLETGTKNPVWDFHMDVEKRKAMDNEDAEEVSAPPSNASVKERATSCQAIAGEGERQLRRAEERERERERKNVMQA